MISENFVDETREFFGALGTWKTFIVPLKQDLFSLKNVYGEETEEFSCNTSEKAGLQT